jgi:myo-inositol 2-dehydrogenase/D-chiro-inositol 1-dehydrogenase
MIARSVHIALLSRMPGVRITAIADSDPASLALASASLPAAATFPDTAAMLSHARLDAVLIALPPHLHADAAVSAFNSGLGVYVEKPLASNLADGDRVIDAWQSARTAGMIGFNYRFSPLNRELRSRIRSGEIGSLVAIRSVFSSANRAVPSWKESRATGGGVLLDLASHHVDLTRFLTGQEIQSVSAEIRDMRAEADTAALTMRLDDGAVAQSFFSLGSADEDVIEVYGDRGKLSVNRMTSLRPEFTPPNATRAQRLTGLSRHAMTFLRGAPYLMSKMTSPFHEPSFRAALEHFIDCVRRGREPSPSLDDGFAALTVVEAAESSAASGATVVVNNSLAATRAHFTDYDHTIQ